jgi:hypothetical protein
LNVWLAVPLVVVRELSPKLLLNANVPSPPTVFLTTVTDPGGGAFLVLVNVQVVVPGATTPMSSGVPRVQLALVRVQPGGTFSLTLYLAPAVKPSNVWLAVPLTVVRDDRPKLLVNANVPSPPTVFFTI